MRRGFSDKIDTLMQFCQPSKESERVYDTDTCVSFDGKSIPCALFTCQCIKRSAGSGANKSIALEMSEGYHVVMRVQVLHPNFLFLFQKFIALLLPINLKIERESRKDEQAVAVESFEFFDCQNPAISIDGFDKQTWATIFFYAPRAKMTKITPGAGRVVYDINAMTGEFIL
jgi:hypothetical protein